MEYITRCLLLEFKYFSLPVCIRILGDQCILGQFINFRGNFKIHLSRIVWLWNKKEIRISPNVTLNSYLFTVLKMYILVHLLFLTQLSGLKTLRTGKPAVLKQFYEKLGLASHLCFLFYFVKFFHYLFTESSTNEGTLMDFSCYIYLDWLKGGWGEEGVYSGDLGASLTQENPASKYSNCSNFSGPFWFTLIVTFVQRVKTTKGKKHSFQTLNFIYFKDVCFHSNTKIW